MNAIKFILSMLSVVLLFTSCDKDVEDVIPTVDPTGSITGIVVHHDDVIPNSTVYLKFNATEFPGTDVSVYDQQVVASDPNASYEFTGLAKGTYYLFAEGFDDACSCDVIGGIPVILESDDQMFETNVPVTE